MKLRTRKTIYGLIVSVLFLGSIGAISTTKTASNEPETVEATSHPDNFELYDYTSYSGHYYDSIQGKDGEGLEGSLRTALTSLIYPKEWYSYSGSGTSTLSSILQQADEDPTNSNNMIYLYTRDSVKKNAANSWNREHVWPKNCSNDCWKESKAGADLLHIRPTYSTPNSTRSNSRYAEITGGEKRTYQGITYGYTKNSYFMPLDASKGDVARITMYVYVAYRTLYGSRTPDITKNFESYDTLLKWHTEDKPDMLEKHRNDVAETSLQKNRNPFVDHPEYAWKIFGSKCSTSVLNECKNAYPENGKKTLTNLTLNGTTKTDYYVGDEFDPSGLTITATYSDGTTANVTNSVTWTPAYLTQSTTSVTGTFSYGGSKLTVSYKVSVTLPEGLIPVQSISLNFSKKTIKEGEEFTLVPTINPSNATIQRVNFDSSDEDVAGVNKNGLVFGFGAGTATLTVTTVDGEKVATCVVTVEKTESKKKNESSKNGVAVAYNVIMWTMFGVAALITVIRIFTKH